MGDVIPFKRRPPDKRAKDKTLCKNGFHKWAVVQEKQFDVKRGQLITVYRCTRCGTTKTQAV